jgi:hypothetical protein
MEVSSEPLPGRYTPGEKAAVNHLAWWASEPVEMLWSREKSLTFAENRTTALKPVARSYTD